MSEAKVPEAVPADLAAPHPDGPRSELTVRAVVVGVIVAVMVGASYPYIVLKIGFGPTISVVSAFLAFIGLSAIAFFTKRRTGRFEFNIVQTAGTASAQAAFMCVALAAFDMLASKPALGFAIAPSPLQIFIWMSVAGWLGVLLAVPLRKHYIDEEKLTFADGTAAGETLVILDSGGEGVKRRVQVLGIGAAIGAGLTWFRDGMAAIRDNRGIGDAAWPPAWVKSLTMPEALHPSENLHKLNVGLALGALEFGSGLIVGLRITVSMALGMVLAWYIAPSILFDRGWTTAPTYQPNLRWVMWPATGLMVSGGLTALALKWKLIKKTFVDLAQGKLAQGSDFPMRWVTIGVISLSVLLIGIQYFSMQIPIWHSIVAILVSVVLMLVGIRVLGETNWAPISAMANMVQAVFAGIAPGNIAVNMVASTMSGTVAGAGEHLMQDYKAGKIIGSNNRALTVMQLIGTPIGAACIALVYPLLRSQYGIGADRYGIDISRAGNGAAGLSSPISVKWAGFAELLKDGISKLPPGALWALVIGVVLGVLITLFEEKHKKILPSPTGMALGMLIPASHMLPMLIGGIVQYVWAKKNPKSEEAYGTPLASGLIVGEALLALIIPVVIFFLSQMGSIEPVPSP